MDTTRNERRLKRFVPFVVAFSHRKEKQTRLMRKKKIKETQTNKAECQGPRDLFPIDSAVRDVLSIQHVNGRTPAGCLRARLKCCCRAKLLADLRLEPDLH